MGAGMSRIIDPDSNGGGGLYLGSITDSRRRLELTRENITHIVSLHENSSPLYEQIEYLCVDALDDRDFDLAASFEKCIDFIHRARVEGGNVLVHCIAGRSRSTTIVVAYLMTCTELDWEMALTAVQARRPQACPNPGFRWQLMDYEQRIQEERLRLRRAYPHVQLNDHARLLEILTSDERWLRTQGAAGGETHEADDWDAHAEADVEEEEETMLNPLHEIE